MKIINNENFLKNIGIGFFPTTPKIKAELYKNPENFIVEEIQKDGKTFSPKKEKLTPVPNPKKKYIHAVLVKKGISTFESCGAIASKNGLNYFKDISFCGLKDTNGLTTQKICLKTKEKLKFTISQRFFLKNFEASNKKLKRGEHQGNRFIIKAKIRSQEQESATKILKNFSNLIKRGLPNFYGPQRFGIRQDNHRLGKLLIKKQYNDFVFRFLTETNNESKEVKQVRRKIKARYGDWEKCASILKGFRKLPDERELILNLLTDNPFLSIKKMKLSSFFVYSYISYLFNLALSLYLSREYKNVEIQKIGLCSRLNKPDKELYELILSKEKVCLEEIRAACKEFSVKGDSRHSLLFPKNFHFRVKKRFLILSFDLTQGQYASHVLDSLFDNQAKVKQKLD